MPPPSETTATGLSPGRVQRSFLSWATGVAGTVAMAGAGFAAFPYLLRWLGRPRFGAWDVIAEWLGYVGLTQWALGPAAITVLLQRALHEDGEAAFVGVARWGWRAYTRASLLAMPVVAALAWFAPNWLHGAAGFATSLRVAIAISGIGGLLLAPALSVLRPVLETRQRSYGLRGAMALQGLVTTGLSLWWVHAGGGLVALAIAGLSAMALATWLCYRFGRRWLPDWRQTPPAEVSAGSAWRLSWPMIAAMVGNQVNLFTDSTMVAFVLGLAAVPGFAATQKLIQFMGSQVTDLGAVSWAALGELRVHDHPRFVLRVNELGATVAGLGIVALGTVAAFDRPFVTLWVGAQYYGGDALAIFTAAAAAVFSFLCLFAALLDTQGDTRRRLGVSTMGSACNLGLSFLLARHWGMAGVAIGTFAAYTATDAWYAPRLVSRLYGVPAAPLARSVLKAAAWGLLFAAAAWTVAHRVAPAHWLSLGAELGAVGAAGIVYCWLLILSPGDREAWRARWQASVAMLQPTAR